MANTRRKNKRDNTALSSSSGASAASSNAAASSTGAGGKRKTKTSKSSKKTSSTNPKPKGGDQKSSSTSKSRAAGAKSKNDGVDASCLLITLLHQLDTLSQSKLKSVAAIQSISNATILHSKIYPHKDLLKSNNHGDGADTGTTVTDMNIDASLEHLLEGSGVAAAASLSSRKKTISRFLAKSSESSMESRQNANLIILATHVMNRILIHLNDIDDGIDENQRDDSNNKRKPKKKATQNDDTSTNIDGNHHEEQRRKFAMIISIYSSTLSKILLHDKTQLERTINASSLSSSSCTTAVSSHLPSGASGGDDTFIPVEGYNAKSILGRSILSSMLSSLRSMYILSNINAPTSTNPSAADAVVATSTVPTCQSPEKVYAKLMWRNAIVIETLLAPGNNYRSSRGKNLTKAGGGSGKISIMQSSLLSASGDTILPGGVNTNHSFSGTSNSNTLGQSSVHNIPMDLRKANAWHKICNAMETEQDLKTDPGTSRGGENGQTEYSSKIFTNILLVDALRFGNQHLFKKSLILDSTTDESNENEVIIKLLLFDHETVSNEENIEDISKPLKKRRKTESVVTSTTATRTRSRTLSEKIDQKSNAYTNLSAQVSSIIFGFDYNKAVLGGNRFNLKKWSSASFSWCCNGQEIALESLRSLLCQHSNIDYNHTNWNELMQVSTLISDAPKKRGKKTTSDRSRKRSNDSSSSTLKINTVNIPGNLVLLTYASRVIDIVNEGGKMAGNSLQNNGIEDYVNYFGNKDTSQPVPVATNSIETKKTKRQSSRKSKETSISPEKESNSEREGLRKKLLFGKINSRFRSDIRQISISLMELLLLHHQLILEENIAKPVIRNDQFDEYFDLTHFSPKFPLENDEVLGQIIVNDDNNDVDTGIAKSSSAYTQSYNAENKYFPIIHKTIETLIRCASSPIVWIEDCSTRLTGIGAALAMKYGTSITKVSGKERQLHRKGFNDINTIVVVDAKLVSWAILQLSVSIGNITFSKQAFCGNTDDITKQKDELTPNLVKHFALDEPISVTSKSIGDFTDGYFGLFSGCVDGGKNLIEIPDQRSIHGEILSLFLRAMIPSNVVKEKGDVEKNNILNLIKLLLRVIVCCYSFNNNNESDNKRRSTFTRFTLAADCIDLVRKCVTRIPVRYEDVGNSSRVLHRLLRQQSITPSILCCFLELGYILDKDIIQQHTENCYETSNGDLDRSSPSVSKNSLHLEYDPWERRLWSSHVKLSLVLSRGYVDFQSKSIPGLGSISNKLAVFKAALNLCGHGCRPNQKWPLFLPSTMHSLITTMLISDAIPRNVKDSTPEIFLCEMMLQSISYALSNPSVLIEKAKRQRKKNVHTSDEEIPFSLRDSRLFVLALCRLPKKDQIGMLSNLVTSLSSEIHKINEDIELRKLLVMEKDYSGLLARVITVTSTSIDMVSAGKPMLDSLCEYIGPLHYYLPSIIDIRGASDSEGSDWYKKESCFMGLWEQWESSSLPSVDMASYSYSLTNDDTLIYSSTINCAIGLGFESAIQDKCLLLFASWNASGKLCGLESNRWEGPLSIDDWNSMSMPSKLVRIRDDVCNMHQSFGLHKTAMPDTFLSKQLNLKQTQNKGFASIGSNPMQLRLALSSNLDILKASMRVSLSHEDFVPTSEEFAVFESTSIYTSFLISMFTSSGTDFLSSIITRDRSQEERKRKGSNTSADSCEDDGSEDSAESENGLNELDEEEDEDYDDLKSEGISRFHDICEKIGVSPIHPDWLDKDCTLRSGISKSVAVAAAVDTLHVLNEFGSIIFNKYISSLKSAILCECKENSLEPSPINVMNGMVNKDNSIGWHGSIGDLYGLDTNLLSLIESGLPCKNLNEVKEAWIPNSAHRIRGMLQQTMSINSWAVTSPELRSGAEWEMLLSDALLGASSDCDHSSLNPEMRKEYHQILRWQRILHGTMSSVVVTTALLRFSLNNCIGRTSHHLDAPVAYQESKDHWYQASPIRQQPSFQDLSSYGISSSQLDSCICNSLNFLSDVQSSGLTPMACKLAAQAATCHLVSDEKDLYVILQAKKLRNFLQGVIDLFAFARTKKEGCIQNVNYILENMIQAEKSISEDAFIDILLFCLGCPSQLKISSLVESAHEVTKIFESKMVKKCLPTKSWQWGISQHESIGLLAQIALGRVPIVLSGLPRLRIIDIIKNALSNEGSNSMAVNGGFRDLFTQQWNKAGKGHITEMILRDICLQNVDCVNIEESNDNIRLSMSRQLTSISVYLSGTMSTHVSKLMFDTLKESSAIWMADSRLDHILVLLFHLSIYLDAVGEIGSYFLSGLDSGSERSLFVFEMFYKFVCDTKANLRVKTENIDTRICDAKKSKQETKPGKSEYVTKAGTLKQRCCTYVTTSGKFSEQHWYNCYTCGLIGDKGCCSLCVQVCHKGHDIGYSRKSSFFCDCGAEVGTDCDRTSCKCLFPLSDETLSLIYDKKLSLESQDNSNTTSIFHQNETKSFWNETTKMLALNFQSTFTTSLSKYLESSHSVILGKLFDIVNTQCETWAESLATKPSYSHESNGNPCYLTKNREPQELSFASRSGKHVDINRLNFEPFTVARIFKASTVNAKMSTESNIDRIKKAFISKNNLQRKIIAADRRGRLVISEASSLIFCCGLSLANIRHQQFRADLQLQRSDLCVIGSVKINSDVVGVEFSPDVQNRIVAWGTSDVNVFIVNDSWNNFVSKIELEVALDPYDSDHDFIVKTEWMTGSSGNVLVVFCATSVKIFDILKSTPCTDDDEYVCQPIASYSITHEDAFIRTGVVFPVTISEVQHEQINKIAILLDTGRLHCIECKFDYDGNIQDTGEFHIVHEEAVSFPMGFQSSSSNIEPGTSTAKSLGEGDLLHFLHQSQLLLYKCSSSPIIAFSFDKSGNINQSFEFLPHVLSTDIFGSSHGYPITGPYTNWNELGKIQRDGSTFHRASFVGRSTRLNQAKLLYMEFNVDTTTITEIKGPSNSLPLTLNTTIDGMVAFSSPSLTGSQTGMISDKSNRFDERIVLVTVSSNGSVTLFDEDLSLKTNDNCHPAENDEMLPELTQRRRAMSDSALSHNKKAASLINTKEEAEKKVEVPTFSPITFENLTNVSEKSFIVFGGDFVHNHDIAKERLSRNSGEFKTLTVSLQYEAKIEGKDLELSTSIIHSGTSHDCENAENLVIVAVRILLGSTTAEYVPKDLKLMGRRIQLKEKLKRWYDIPLTDEEILLVAQSGTLTISVGASLDTASSPHIINSVEVFAQEKKKLKQFILCQKSDDLNKMKMIEDTKKRKSLDTSIFAIASICSLLDKKVDLSSQMNLETLKRLIQVTALDSPSDGNCRDHVVNLVRSVETNPHSMQMLLDEGTLHGVSNALKESMVGVSLIPLKLRQRVLSKVNDCLDVALLIARDRPMNYKSAIEKLISSGYITCSVALQVKKILRNCITDTSFVKTSSKCMQLALFESIANEDIAITTFANLELVAEILRCRNGTVVKECCIKLAETLKDVQSLDKVQAYQCDGCTIFPITGTRYTLEDENIDLCNRCFESGKLYAVSKQFRASTPVLVNKKKLQMECGKVMSCSQIRQMTDKLVPSNIIEKVKEAKAFSDGDLNQMVIEDVDCDDDNNDDDDDAELQMALKMSLETNVEEANGQDSIVDHELQRTGSYIIHMNVIKRVLEDIEQSISTDGVVLVHHPIPIFDLLLMLVSQCDSVEDKIAFGKKVCDVICSNMFSIVENYQSNDSEKNINALVLYLRALEGLATGQNSISGIINKTKTVKDFDKEKKVITAVTTDRVGSTSKEKTDPRFVCEVHGIPAVRRRCSHGENKDRRFYVCGKDRNNRCKYFKWADEGENSVSNRNVNSRGNLTTNLNALDDLNNAGSSSDDVSVKVDPGLKSLLWDIINDKRQPLQQRLCSLLQSFFKKLDSETNDPSNDESKRNTNVKIAKFHEIMRQSEIRESINSSKWISNCYKPEKLGKHERDLPNKLRFKVSQPVVSEISLVEASLDLLSKIAMNALRGSENPQSSWEGWFALLCEIISGSSSFHLRSQAKKMMKRLCGGQNIVYHQIRDQYVFGFQFMKLMHHCEAPLQAALDIREKARRCGPHWRLAGMTWETLSTGGLLGLQELISEDYYTMQKMELVTKTLNDLINSAQTRSKNWSHFCALDKMPQKNACILNIQERSPICVLLWMTCSLPPLHQVKLLQLIDIAMSESCTKQLTTSGGTDVENTTAGYKKSLLLEKESPQTVLLRGASGMRVNDIHAFIMCFILNGADSNIRSLACNVCLSILANVSKVWVEKLIQKIIVIMLSDIGILGCKAIEFISFVRNVVSNKDVIMGVDVTALLQATVVFYTEQSQVISDTKLWSGKEMNSVQIESKAHSHSNRMYDFAPCLHCHIIPIFKRTSHQGDIDDNVTRTVNDARKGAKVSQVIKRSLDNCSSETVSTEFSCHIQLKHRMSISEVHLNVSDPRGRFAKTIGVYFTSRPVKNVNELKDLHYAPLWQRCGTIALPRGGSKMTLKLTCPIVAANLKIEYEEFYEKISNSRSSGAIVIHCPRCTRVVHNAHGGVCGHCGEVAFQCRKCRHINYDRLDAFLCVECGYCSSGSFSYEISVSPSSRAVAIVDDEGLESAIRLMLVTSNKYNEYKCLLTKRLQNASSLSGTMRQRDRIEASMSKLNSPLKRAFLGDLPKIGSKKSSRTSKRRRGPVNDSLDAENHVETSSDVNRARSLLNLALTGGVPDSLSRLVANIARARTVGMSRRNKRNRDETNDEKQESPEETSDGEPASANTEALSIKAIESCDKLYFQMRQLERESFEFRKRIEAWKRLNHDALANYGSEPNLTNVAYGTSQCSFCSSKISHHLLELIHVLFTSRNNTHLRNASVFKKFVCLLFNEGIDSIHPDLVNLKRSTIIAIATESSLGSEMVFNELKMRLQGSQSVACAEILGDLIGSLVAEDVQSYDQFIQLALQILK